jgi:hypothetical protein
MQYFIGKLGELNPQLLREIKGHWQLRNILLAVTVSFSWQFMLFIYCQSQIPHKYTRKIYDQIVINWDLWNQDAFNLLSLIGIFTILVGGSYLLINDLSHEENRGTLNFIRLSPQSPQSILYGKMLGVPIFLYVVSLLAIPFHLWLGVNAQIPLGMIFGFYAVLIASSLFYFSAALLFGLVSSWLRQFQVWLGSGLILGFLLLSQEALKNNLEVQNYPFVIFRLFNPYYFIPYSNDFGDFQIAKLYWFSLPLGNSYIFTLGLGLLIYLVATYFIWQSLQRCYLDKNVTMLSKKQSYLLTCILTSFTLGFTNWQSAFTQEYFSRSQINGNLACLMFLDLWLFLYLIAALTPNRQTLQDWSRYRHIYSSHKLGKSKLINDLIWGEKSPGIVAIALNAFIAIVCLIFLIVVVPTSANYKFYALLSLVFAGTLTVIYAALAQLLLLMKNDQRLFWTNGILIAVITLPPFILTILSTDPGSQPLPWLFTVAAPLVILFPPGGNVAIIPAFLAIIGHTVILSLLLFKVTHQLKKSGESATKIILAGN